MNTRLAAVFCVFWFAAFIVAASSNANEDRRPNFVFLISEDTSKHHLELFDEHGVKTPNIESLASQGLKFRHAFSNSPVCSVARTTLMTGCYPSLIGAHHHRSAPKIDVQDQIQFFPALLKKSGYYTSNRQKTDYNVSGGMAAWNDSSKKATWRNRNEGQPFFHMQTFPISHEGRLQFPAGDLRNKPVKDLDKFYVQPKHPDTELFRYTRARLHQQIQKMDGQLGKVVDQLRQDGLLDNTWVFYFGDHGGPMPGSKAYLYETGLHVPLIVRVPESYRSSDWQPNQTVDRFVSFVDFGPTLLDLANVELPAYACGSPFLDGAGKFADRKSKFTDTTFGFADRFDEQIRLVRSVRKGNYKYIRNFTPWYPDSLQNNYRFQMPAYQQWRELHFEGALNATQSGFFQRQPMELLFDVATDPYETINLVDQSEYRDILKSMRALLTENQIKYVDTGIFPESFLRDMPSVIRWLRDHVGRDVEESTELTPFKLGQLLVEEKQFEDLLGIFRIDSKSESEFRKTIHEILEGSDPIRQRFALQHCTAINEASFQDAAETLLVKSRSAQVTLAIAEYLFWACGDRERGIEQMLNLLGQCEDAFFATEVLNSIVAIRDHGALDKREMARLTGANIVDLTSDQIRSHKNVQRRLQYLTR